MPRPFRMDCPFTGWTAHDCPYVSYDDKPTCVDGMVECGGIGSHKVPRKGAWCNKMIARALRIPQACKMLGEGGDD